VSQTVLHGARLESCVSGLHKVTALQKTRLMRSTRRSNNGLAPFAARKNSRPAVLTTSEISSSRFSSSHSLHFRVANHIHHPKIVLFSTFLIGSRWLYGIPVARQEIRLLAPRHDDFRAVPASTNLKQLGMQHATSLQFDDESYTYSSLSQTQRHVQGTSLRNVRTIHKVGTTLPLSV
jgi:hypothetical protein